MQKQVLQFVSLKSTCRESRVTFNASLQARDLCLRSNGLLLATLRSPLKRPRISTSPAPEMSDPDPKAISVEVEKIVRDAKRREALHTLTPRIIRAAVEQALLLPEGLLATKEYKNIVKEAVDAAVKDTASVKDAEEASKKPESKRPTAPTKRAKKLQPSADSGEEDSIDPRPLSPTIPGPAAEPKKKSGPTKSKSSGAAKANKTRKGPSSASVIEDSDDDNESPNASTSKVAPTKVSTKEDASENEREEPPKKRLKTAQKPTFSETAKKPLAILCSSDAEKSESEMSVLLDDPPKKGRKKGANQGSSKGKEPTKRKPRSSGKELSKDEGEIKRLKSFVVACGVRKVWSKEFQGLDQPSQQIKHLKEILAGLGMTGRLSLEKAKAIKEKREFAQELEDVNNFAKEMAVKGRQDRKTRGGKQVDKEASDEELEEPTSKPRKKNARQSIMAFLGDESDE
ncbi:hypothetical protein JAAARDRAFT_30914 [Jaapia argillacea MUCL 33604]|uniref:Uncharacterized protein n=1 Tax=Jaapia argillacea MUCL 33604 TaxID=933084 RepID=A0A067Q355_9AGAM|nr:hypothetical protein JAAARDRAFT_30914 [Jaapia argillacea MUCL 33604]